MNLLFDTNIILNIVRATDFSGIIYHLNPDDSPVYLSVVSEAEIKSLALRNRWGINRRNILDNFLDQVNIVEINQLCVNIYAEIDAYSQRMNPSFENYAFDTSRNMGKNDLWIASLGALLGLRLITTDSDFDHLHNVFFEVERIKPEAFLPFFK
jgi:tRNA(fMet)-specific endonuclease VapC